MRQLPSELYSLFNVISLDLLHVPLRVLFGNGFIGVFLFLYVGIFWSIIYFLEYIFTIRFLLLRLRDLRNALECTIIMYILIALTPVSIITLAYGLYSSFSLEKNINEYYEKFNKFYSSVKVVYDKYFHHVKPVRDNVIIRLTLWILFAASIYLRFILMYYFGTSSERVSIIGIIIFPIISVIKTSLANIFTGNYEQLVKHKFINSYFVNLLVCIFIFGMIYLFDFNFIATYFYVFNLIPGSVTSKLSDMLANIITSLANNIINDNSNFVSFDITLDVTIGKFFIVGSNSKFFNSMVYVNGRSGSGDQGPSGTNSSSNQDPSNLPPESPDNIPVATDSSLNVNSTEESTNDIAASSVNTTTSEVGITHSLSGCTTSAEISDAISANASGRRPQHFLNLFLNPEAPIYEKSIIGTIYRPITPEEGSKYIDKYIQVVSSPERLGRSCVSQWINKNSSRDLKLELAHEVLKHRILWNSFTVKEFDISKGLPSNLIFPPKFYVWGWQLYNPEMSISKNYSKAELKVLTDRYGRVGRVFSILDEELVRLSKSINYNYSITNYLSFTAEDRETLLRQLSVNIILLEGMHSYISFIMYESINDLILVVKFNDNIEFVDKKLLLKRAETINIRAHETGARVLGERINHLYLSSILAEVPMNRFSPILSQVPAGTFNR